ncbi:piercer of microtubule wall 2 protein-like isoform X2 [Patella vulgata]|uniref:piercer of microtubule wall 2 protein-like isoform X2 n=1 Tax=Patella vulgata TaxID=6465 RepID=UPI0024A8068E|nr:piercer of microtubule wall 2 protein-like isoform X2 [Patella vulgata]
MSDTAVQQQQNGEFGPGGVPKGAQTHEFYRIKEVPSRFDNPGYGGKKQHPMYRTTSATYGSRAPSVHTMPTTFHAKSQQFSETLGKCGMYRNHSLNTGMDQSNV